MNKNDLINEFATRSSLSQKDSRYYLNTLMDIISDELAEGNHIMLQGFGTFTRWEQNPRLGRNPRTGKECLISARNSAKFKPGKMLLKRLNE